MYEFTNFLKYLGISLCFQVFFFVVVVKETILMKKK